MFVSELWRFPVKSMRGERLERAVISREGLFGDRLVGVIGGRGRVVTARLRPQLLLHHATLGPDGEPLVDGRLWSSDDVGRELRASLKDEGARLVKIDPMRRYDMLPLLVTTDGAIEAFGHDGRRLRPNIVIGGSPGLAERTLAGRHVRIGPVLIGFRTPRERCIMVTYDPETNARNLGVLEKTREHLDGRVGLDAYVIEGGDVSVGDRVSIER